MNRRFSTVSVDMWCQEAFLQRLIGRLQSANISLLAANLGRHYDTHGLAWVTVIQSPDGVASAINMFVDRDGDPTSDATCDDVARRLIQHVEKRMEPMMTFGQAIEALKAGKRVSRTGWNGRGMRIGLERPDPDVPTRGPMTLPYIFIRTVNGDHVPWVASQTDMLAEDWVEAP